MNRNFENTLPVGAELDGRGGRYRVKEVFWRNDIAIVYLAEEILSYYKEPEMFIMTELYVRSISERKGAEVICDTYLATYHKARRDYLEISKYLPYHARHVGNEKDKFEQNGTFYHIYKRSGRKVDELYNWDEAFSKALTHEEDREKANREGKKNELIYKAIVFVCMMITTAIATRKNDETLEKIYPYAESLVLNHEQPLLKPPYPESFSFRFYDENITMILVKGGRFMMGAAHDPGRAHSDEFPVHEVILSDYYISKHEVTNNFFSAVMYGKRGDYYPAVYVKWTEAWDFIRNLNKITGHKFSLPTEAQWEFAARGGNRSRGYIYSGSDDLDEVALYGTRYDKDEPKGIRVGGLKANELGIHDMSGNAPEWCYDIYRRNAYSESGKENPAVHWNPKNKKSGRRHVVRGGGWWSDPGDCRVSERASEEETAGFRIVLNLPVSLEGVDTMNVAPRFIGGGSNTFPQWVSKSIRYPAKSKEYGVEGRVRILYKINEKGRVDKVRVLEGSYSMAGEEEINALKERLPEELKDYVRTMYTGLDCEAERVVSRSPSWLPAVRDGVPVPVTDTITVTFKLLTED